jgi:trk system potassium uptake protein TrkA
MGCGRVGARMAHDVEQLGHTVAVIDQDPHAFRRLHAGFAGERVTGVGFDRDTLVAARIEEAFAFAAVSSGDNSNILAARTARETYGVERVVARIYDPGRAAVYQRLGIPTVATVPWTSEQMLRRLLPTDSSPEYTDPTGGVSLVELPVSPAWIGHRLTRLEAAAGVRVAYVLRLGSAAFPDPDTVLQDGDVVHALIRAGKGRAAEKVAQAGPG